MPVRFQSRNLPNWRNPNQRTVGRTPLEADVRTIRRSPRCSAAMSVTRSDHGGQIEPARGRPPEDQQLADIEDDRRSRRYPQRSVGRPPLRQSHLGQVRAGNPLHMPCMLVEKGARPPRHLDKLRVGLKVEQVRRRAVKGPVGIGIISAANSAAQTVGGGQLLRPVRRSQHGIRSVIPISCQPCAKPCAQRRANSPGGPSGQP